MKKVDEDHGPVEDMALTIAYLATQETATSSGAVFSIIAIGRIINFSEPAPIETIKINENSWTIEELIREIPEKLLKEFYPLEKGTNLHNLNGI